MSDPVTLTPEPTATPEPVATTTPEPATTEPVVAEPVVPAPTTEPATPAPTVAAPEPVAEPVAPEPTTDPNERVVPLSTEYNLPEGFPPHIAEFAHENGYTQEQLDATMTYFGQVSTTAKQAELNAIRQLGEAHVKGWGEKGQFNLNIAKRALQQNDTDGALGKALKESGYVNHPAVLNFLVKLGSNMQEAGYLKSESRRPPGQKTPAQRMFGKNHPSSEA